MTSMDRCRSMSTFEGMVDVGDVMIQSCLWAPLPSFTGFSRGSDCHARCFRVCAAVSPFTAKEETQTTISRDIQPKLIASSLIQTSRTRTIYPSIPGHSTSTTRPRSRSADCAARRSRPPVVAKARTSTPLAFANACVATASALVTRALHRYSARVRSTSSREVHLVTRRRHARRATSTETKSEDDRPAVTSV
jgi:hypothetical protein